MINNINSIVALTRREFTIMYKSFYDVLSIMLFFLLGILIFIFSIGSEKEIFNQISIGVIWTLILLSNTLSLRKFFQNDFDDNNIILLHMSGLSYELIVLIKILIVWFCLQIPFLVIIAIGSILLDVDYSYIKFIFLSFLIGSPVITCISAISGSMNLLNKQNFAIGSLIIMILSIPVIIFSVSLSNTSVENFRPQVNILIGILFFFLSITPWICSICLKLGLENK